MFSQRIFFSPQNSAHTCIVMMIIKNLLVTKKQMLEQNCHVFYIMTGSYCYKDNFKIAQRLQNYTIVTICDPGKQRRAANSRATVLRQPSHLDKALLPQYRLQTQRHSAKMNLDFEHPITANRELLFKIRI